MRNLFSTLWVYLFFSSNATNRHFWLSSLESRGNLFFWIVLVACESSFNLCKFNFESQREGFSLSKIFTETKLEITRHMKGYWHFQGYTFKAHWHFLQNFYFAHKTIKKTCNYILKICATRTDIGIFEGTRSYAALRAADQDWIVGPGDSSGGYILGCSQRVVFPCFTFYNLS